MDSRLTRGMAPADAEDWAKWFQAARPYLAELARVLDAASAASRDTGDKAEVFSNPNALALLAHKAGYREGLAEAIKVLTPRK